MKQQDFSLKTVNDTINILQNTITQNSEVASHTDTMVRDINQLVEEIVSSTHKQIF